MLELNIDEELNKIREKKLSLSNNKSEISNITKDTDFSNELNKAKISILAEASTEDNKFIDRLKKELKEASIKSAQLEKDKQELERKNIELQQNFINTQNKLQNQVQQENKWNNKEKSRQYHYNGLKDIMHFIHINNPMCVPLMYLFALLVSPIYIIWTLVLCPIGTLIAGTKDNQRPKFVKSAIATILLITFTILIILGFYALSHYVFKFF